MYPVGQGWSIILNGHIRLRRVSFRHPLDDSNADLWKTRWRLGVGDRRTRPRLRGDLGPRSHCTCLQGKRADGAGYLEVSLDAREGSRLLALSNQRRGMQPEGGSSGWPVPIVLGQSPNMHLNIRHL
ncbi:MAG: hypothetical protein A2Z37_17035 [Chloroflexi bacterium RBG_19FT_COMBO_62_14]|nr:MAG: hypothetical protein A2Z37_17035 [Chloroflexi bacterium RBG_19FT_COMBO_62_14]